MGKFVFDFDPDKCTACCACSMACMDQNDLDAKGGQHPFRSAFQLERTERHGTAFGFLSVACMHCEDAPCVLACPAGCLFKDEESGLTLYDNTSCIGCHSCAMACPFGAPSFGADGKMVKCDGCITRLQRGMIPACVRVCPTGALTCQSEEEWKKQQRDKSLKTLAQRLLQEKEIP